jgi:subtilisin family serine protease
VAVLDSGCQTNLAEFSGRVVPGYNFVSNNADASDDHGHGTAVAATLCANANNATGIAGVDWRCRLMPLKVLDQFNNGYYSWWAQAIDYAVSNGCKVINLSAGGSSSDFTLTRAITNAIAHGVIFVTITHNDGAGAIRFPGSLPESITVGATDEMDRRAGFSNYGPQIDLVAPGTNIATISLTGALQKWWGTSFAAPQVAGVCALLAAVRPSLDQDQARALLCAGADDQVGDVMDTPGFDKYYGWGRLNAFNSLLLAQTRIDDIRQPASNTVVLSWASPANASNKQPCQIETVASFTSSWTPDPSTYTFHYGTNRTWCTNSGAVSGTEFYRLRLKQD